MPSLKNRPTNSKTLKKRYNIKTVTILQLEIQVSQVNRKPSSWDIKGAQGFPHIAENE